MNTENNIFITASELSELLEVSTGHAYKIIRELNQELLRDGYMVISGRVSCRYFEKRWFGHSA